MGSKSAYICWSTSSSPSPSPVSSSSTTSSLSPSMASPTKLNHNNNINIKPAATTTTLEPSSIDTSILTTAGFFKKAASISGGTATHQMIQNRSQTLLQLQKEIKEEEDEIFADIDSLLNSRTLEEYDHEESHKLIEDEKENGHQITNRTNNHQLHENNHHLTKVNNSHLIYGLDKIEEDDRLEQDQMNQDFLIQDSDCQYQKDLAILNDTDSSKNTAMIVLEDIDSNGNQRHDRELNSNLDKGQQRLLDRLEEDEDDDDDNNTRVHISHRSNKFAENIDERIVSSRGNRISRKEDFNKSHNRDNHEQVHDNIDEHLVVDYDQQIHGDITSQQDITIHDDIITENNVGDDETSDALASDINMQNQQHYEQLQAIIKQVTSSLPKPCVFFLEGNCRRSDCKFSHDLSSIPCKYWIEGFCFKGELCPFSHDFSNVPHHLLGDLTQDLDGVALDENGRPLSPMSASKREQQQLNPTFVIDSEADFPSLPIQKRRRMSLIYSYK